VDNNSIHFLRARFGRMSQLLLLLSVCILSSFGCEDSIEDCEYVNDWIAGFGNCDNNEFFRDNCPNACGVACPCIYQSTTFAVGTSYQPEPCMLLTCENDGRISADVTHCEDLQCEDTMRLFIEAGECCGTCQPKLNCEGDVPPGAVIETGLGPDACGISICDPEGSGNAISDAEICPEMSCGADEYRKSYDDACCDECVPKSDCQILAIGEIVVEGCMNIICDPEGSGQITTEHVPCPAEITCDEGSHWRKEEGECCSSCKVDQLCSWEDDYRQPYDSWSDPSDPCIYLQCDAEGSGTVFEFTIECNAYSYCHSDEIWMVPDGQCCAECVSQDIPSCEMDGVTYEPGSTWPSSSACLSFMCSLSGQILTNNEVCFPCDEGEIEIHYPGDCCPTCSSSSPSRSPSKLPSKIPTFSPSYNPTTSFPSVKPITSSPTFSIPTHNPSSPQFTVAPRELEVLPFTSNSNIFTLTLILFTTLLVL